MQPLITTRKFTTIILSLNMEFSNQEKTKYGGMSFAMFLCKGCSKMVDSLNTETKLCITCQEDPALVLLHIPKQLIK